MTGSSEPTNMLDVIVVPEGDMAGTWIRADQRLAPRAERRLMEMIAGRQRVIESAKDEGTRMSFGAIKLASKEQWAIAVGLAFVDQAVRVTI
jgi:hypothetical protein